MLIMVPDAKLNKRLIALSEPFLTVVLSAAPIPVPPIPDNAVNTIIVISIFILFHHYFTEIFLSSP